MLRELGSCSNPTTFGGIAVEEGPGEACSTGDALPSMLWKCHGMHVTHWPKCVVYSASVVEADLAGLIEIAFVDL